MNEVLLLLLVSALYLALGVWVIRRTSESGSAKAKPVNYKSGAGLYPNQRRHDLN